MAATTESSLGVLAQAAINKYLQQATRYEEAVLADTDPENLHQMRVGLRRLRTALQVFAPSLQMPAAGESDQVGKVARRLGRLRDLDVVMELLEQHYLPDLPDAEQVLLRRVLEQLQAQRADQFKRVKKLLKGKRYRRLKTALTSWLDQPSWGAIAPLPALQAVPDLVLPLASQTWLHPGWLVGAEVSQGTVRVDDRITVDQADRLIRASSETLHSLRKQIKRLRYQLKVVSSLYGEALDADLQRLSDMQDTLGQLQDSLVISDVLSQAIPDARQAMPTLMALMADQRHRAWRTWQALQQHYLDVNNRMALRQQLAIPVQLSPAVEAAPDPSDNLRNSRRQTVQRTAKRTAKRRPSSRTSRTSRGGRRRRRSQ